MRIVVMGQAAFGAKFLEEIVKRENVIAVYGPPDPPKGKPDPIKGMATDKGIPYYQPTNYKLPEVLAEFQTLKADLLILAFVTAILKPEFLNTPTLGSICYHPSLLPRHRGGSAINWAVIMGDSKTGLTIFWPDGGIDTGPMLLQKEVAISPEATTGALYFDHLFAMGVDALLESVDLIKKGTAPRIPQDEKLATYEPLCTDAVAQIDWSKSAAEVYNLIRGCDPQPGAYAKCNQKLVRFYGPKLEKGEPGAAAGTILGCDETGLSVATKGGILRITRVRAEGAQKATAREFFSAAQLKAGDRFE
jgi:methionyl-tRNA formyltransferase